jgi:RNA methyltransferase, TrmH family
MKTISSRQNALFKRVRRAIDEHAEEIVIEGPKAIDDAIANGWKPLVIIGREGASARGRVGEVVVSAALFDSVASTVTSQGVLALFERPSFGDLFADRDRIIVALDGVQDPGNVGTIVRLAAAFDAGGVVLLPGTADAYSPKSIRASAGAILTVPVVSMKQEELLCGADAPAGGAPRWPIFAADASGEAIDPPSRGAVIVFGSEGGGVSREIAERATKIAIPMSSRIESLNVASSAAILLARSYARAPKQR